MCFVDQLRSQCAYCTDELQSFDKPVQVKDTQLSQLQGEHCIQASVHPIQPESQAITGGITLSYTGQLETVKKVLQAKDTELQAMQKLMKGSEGETFYKDSCQKISACK